jgi:hypothetical protein
MHNSATFKKFSAFVWQRMPVRKIVLGKEAVADIVMIAVQMWPVERLSQAEHASEEEADALRVLCEDIMRIMQFVWGEERYRAFTLLGIETCIPHVIDIIAEWWRGQKTRRGKLNNWRRKWVVDG